MGNLRKWFGPSRDEVWRQLSAEIGGQMTAGTWKTSAKVTIKVGEWTVTLDEYSVSNGKTTVTFTRFRAPYVNKDGFRFRMTRKNIFSGLAEWLGAKDILVGFPEFDEAFVLKSNQPDTLKRFCASPAIRSRLAALPQVWFLVQDDEGWFGREFPEGVDQLVFTCGVCRDIERLKLIFDLFAITLDRLCEIGSAYEDDPKMTS